MPDVVIGHVGFGSVLYAPDIFPKALHAYFEWFCIIEGADVAFFGGRERVPISQKALQRHSNMCVLSGLEAPTIGFCPTRWQRDQHPERYHDKLHIVHDGVDTDFFSPEPDRCACMD